MNYLSVDVDRVADVVKSLNDLWALPLQLAMVLYLLYVQVSFAFLAGVAFSAALVPVNVWLTKRIQKVQTDLMHENDKRVLRVTEIIRNITYIKMCGWSRLVQSWVNESRVQYLKHLKWLKYLDSFCVFFWAATPTIVSLFTFITFILMGGHLTPGKAVTALALFGSLIMPLNAYPWVINGVVEAYVSWQRLKPFLSPHQMSGSDCCYNAASFTRKRFETNKTNRDENFVLAAGEVQPLLDGRWFLVPPRESPCSVLGNTRGRHCEAGVEATLVDIAHCTVSYGTHETIGDKESSFTLRITAFKALRGQLTAIVGVSGSGKSTFLDALAGELDLRSDTAVARVFISRLSVAYVEQQPFLTSGTLRDNIVFGLPFEPARYEAVLAAVALTDDIRLHFAPCGDLSPVGDRGIRLSGGQRVRVALARALYANKGLYLFDDVFGCLDATVARHVVEHAILATVRSGGSVIIATHCQEIICQADAVYKCVDGQLVFVEQSLVTGSCQAVGAGSLKASCTRKERSIECANFAEEKLARVAGDAARGDEKAAGSMVSVGAVEQALDSPSSSPGADPHKALYGDTKLETTEHGALAWATVMCYINRVGCLLSIVITASIAAMQASRNLSDQYLVGWSRSENRDASAFVQTLALLSAVNSVLALTRGFSFAFGGLRAAERFHEELLNHILSATFTFFSSTQPGCIINRLSSDTYTIDNSLPFIANIFLAQSFLLLGSVIVVVVNSSIFLVLTLMPLAFLYYCIQLPYRCASRELRRVEEAARAPLLDNMRDALDGGVVIRSLGGQALETHLRRAHNSVDLLLRVQFNSCLLSAWFAIRLELVGLLLMLIIGILAVCSHGSTRAPFMGLALAYVQPLTSYVSGLLSAFATTETHLISVERVRQYFSLASEGTNKREVWLSPLVRWPTLGRVNFVDVSMRYDPNGARVLQGLSFSVEAGERVAIVGRTGAGKSSIFCALLRLCEIEQGSIMIDGEDIRQFPLDQLRTRLGVLPQQPFVFHGTLRKNIDPFDLHDDDDVRAAMACVKLGSLDLDFNISDSNSMSCSQRHQVALARVILQRSPLLLLDEPSSQSSDDAEEALWESLSDHLGGTTVLCITHKLAHIDFFDRVLVVDGGRVVNSGTPTQLRSARVWPFLTGYDTTVQLD
ncbi:putative ABC transporter transmembrane region ABC transporter [Trypanosoma vivax]|nr:putative ABC transporter transmembrane region ABC transporter [Trypanosoma vivax]